MVIIFLTESTLGYITYLQKYKIKCYEDKRNNFIFQQHVFKIEETFDRF